MRSLSTRKQTAVLTEFRKWFTFPGCAAAPSVPPTKALPVSEATSQLAGVGP